jgi:hypothetical protein
LTNVETAPPHTAFGAVEGSGEPRLDRAFLLVLPMHKWPMSMLVLCKQHVVPW